MLNLKDLDDELRRYEWHVRRRNAEAIGRGDTVGEHELGDLAAGYLAIIDVLEEEGVSSQIEDLEDQIEDLERDAGDQSLLDWRCNGKEADRLLHVPITNEIYNELVEASNQIDALDTKDGDTSAAVVAFASLSSWAELRVAARNLRDAAQAVADHKPPNRRRR